MNDAFVVGTPMAANPSTYASSYALVDKKTRPFA
jgi:hypothetical protein